MEASRAAARASARARILDAAVQLIAHEGINDARTVDHLLALLDGYGIRALIDDFSIARAREDIWAAIAPELHVTE